MFPENIEEIYRKGESVWYFKSDYELDNIESMSLFLEKSGILPEQILENDGTQCFIHKTGEELILILNSSGGGDFYTHNIEVEFYPFDQYISEKYK